MRAPISIVFFWIFLEIVIPAFGSGCTSKPAAPSFKPGEMLFVFDPENVLEVTIAKNDPGTGDRWVAEITRQKPKSSYEDAAWIIGSSTQTQALQDRQADGNFIHHLMDTIRTVQFSGVPAKGPAASFGLEPPRFAVRWKADHASFELRLGDEKPSDEGSFYAQVKRDGDPETGETLVIRGAATRMLEFLSTFSKLRKQTIATVQSDDVDEIQLKKGKSVFFYAQRDGSEWTDRNHKPIRKVDVSALLDRLTHARIKEFIDNAELSSELRGVLKKNPAYEAVLIPRKGEAKSLRLVWYQPKGYKGRQLWAEYSARDPAVFEAHPEMAQFFELSRK